MSEQDDLIWGLTPEEFDEAWEDWEQPPLWDDEEWEVLMDRGCEE